MRYLSKEVVPMGGSIEGVFTFLQDADTRKAMLDRAEAKTLADLEALRNAPDNPWGTDYETLAGVVLDRVYNQKKR
jgi:hypothetical protein